MFLRTRLVISFENVHTSETLSNSRTYSWFPVQSGPGAHPGSCTMGTRSFPGVKSGWGVTLAPHPLLVPWSRKGRAIPLLPLWAVRPVQSLGACTRVHFTFYSWFHWILVQSCIDCYVLNLFYSCLRWCILICYIAINP